MGFQDAVMEGLAPDGGLLLPDRLPDVSDQLAYWATLSYQDLTFEVLRRFVDLPAEDLKGLIRRSYERFTHAEIAPAWPVGPLWILELFHGPTLAFKDIALQFLGNFFDYTLRQRQTRLNILGATSGDTGSAAIHGARGRDRMNIFIMHPRGRTSPLQEKQMTSVLDANVHNLAIEGTFDDCQNIMKAIFRDTAFKGRYALGAINSVNWARVLAQIVYYFSSGLYVMARTGAARVSFAVPTGNFGDILAGWLAARMGLPIARLVLATNENDILSRFFNTGTYSLGDVVPTLSPSMDIQVASNFERYLYYRVGQDAAEAVRPDGYVRPVRAPRAAAGEGGAGGRPVPRRGGRHEGHARHHPALLEGTPLSARPAHRGRRACG
jgi:threonine synthase